MRRSLLTFLTVVCLASWIQGLESAAGVPRPKIQWVRTVEGWESRHAVDVRSQRGRGELHPGLVAAFILGASIFSLVAFPARVAVHSAPSLVAVPRRRGAPASRAASAAG